MGASHRHPVNLGVAPQVIHREAAVCAILRAGLRGPHLAQSCSILEAIHDRLGRIVDADVHASIWRTSTPSVSAGPENLTTFSGG